MIEYPLSSSPQFTAVLPCLVSRQSKFGIPSLVCVDTTHRLIIESHCVMLIGTMSPTQNFHTIAYAVCSHEDISAHVYVLRQVRDAVNALVAERASKKQRV